MENFFVMLVPESKIRQTEINRKLVRRINSDCSYRDMDPGKNIPLLQALSLKGMERRDIP